ncbi:GNAT family N-acetyltransferase [Winogradskyella sp. PE311]|uniref:GNAT family N-acetyltransferase n=1 Tax=Winogradskyella sp. PE311 TaxID=3366943 RepID=UPI00397FB2F8
MIKIIRTDAHHKDFKALVKQLDAYLKVTDGDEHDFYNQFNAIENLNHVIIAKHNNEVVGCGAFKNFDDTKVEVKRMFTVAKARKKGVASKILKGLEDWAKELGYAFTLLETGIRQTEAVEFYKKNAYQLTSNYGQYIGIENSLCFKKKLNKQ